MQLRTDTATTIVEEWSSACATPWQSAQKRDLAKQLVELAAHVEPHLVQDVVLDQSRVQAYLLARTVARLEDWLLLAAARLRHTLGVEAIRLKPGSDQPALGLRSANHDDVEALPGIGDNLAEEIRRYLAFHPKTEDLEDLQNINGVGPSRIEQLCDSSYLDSPTFNLVSPTMWAFALVPSIANTLSLLDNTDASLWFGDHNVFARTVPVMAASTYERFAAFVSFVIDRTKLSVSGAAGSLASEADQWLQRHEKRKELLNRVQRTTAALLINESYIESVRALIDAAVDTITLMVFLGTSVGGDDGLGPLPLIEALEAAAVRGVTVRVILDQDDGGATFGSFLINMPLVNRFKANAIDVKLDNEDTLLHSKVLVVDDQTCVVGSHNWTRAGFTRTHELSVIVENATVAAAFRKRFDLLWDSLPAV